jgi:UPF0755 protein
MDENQPENKVSYLKSVIGKFKDIKVNRTFFLIVLALAVIVSMVAFIYSVTGPRIPAGMYDEKNPLYVEVVSGESVNSISKKLKNSGIVRFSSVFQSVTVLYGGENRVKAGFYLFDEPQNVFAVSKRIMQGDFGYVPVRITIPEGSDSKKIAEILSDKYPSLSATTTEEYLRKFEGYLFPDTYFFAPMDSLENIVKKMRTTFDRKIRKFEDQINSSGKSINEILTIASMLEREVRSLEDMRKVADVIQKRIDIDMPLQIDATFMYFLGKGSAELTLAELRTDHPYNTYTRKGLPPGPIGNPGLMSIEAVLTPIKNKYFFYLSDNNGINHFAETYKEHLANKNKYLR